jgi:hypothetical protein
MIKQKIETDIKEFLNHCSTKISIAIKVKEVNKKTIKNQFKISRDILRQIIQKLLNKKIIFFLMSNEMFKNASGE